MTLTFAKCKSNFLSRKLHNQITTPRLQNNKNFKSAQQKVVNSTCSSKPHNTKYLWRYKHILDNKNYFLGMELLNLKHSRITLLMEGFQILN